MTILNWINRHFNQLISLFIAIAVVWIASLQGRELLDALKQVRLKWALAGLGCYGINYLLRALRIKVVINASIRFWPDAVHTACLHGLATYLLPFRSGDFTLPVILKKASGLNLSDGAKVLIVVRMLDLCALGGWILAVAVLIDLSLPAMVRGAWVIFGGALLILPLILKLTIRLGKRLRGRFWKKIIRWGEGTASLDVVSFFVSVGIWTCVGGCFYCTAKAIDLPLGFLDVWLLISIQLPLQMIPLQGVANAGNHEGGWVAGLALLGMPADVGLQFALLSHALLLTYVLALGPLAFFIRSSSKNVSPTKG